MVGKPTKGKGPLLTVVSAPMKWIGNKPFKFLGKKLWIFNKVLMSKISLDFLIHDMTVSVVEDLVADLVCTWEECEACSGTPTHEAYNV